MDVVAFLPDRLLAHVRVVLGAQHTVTAVREWLDLETAMQDRFVDVLVVDPAVMGRTAVTALQQVRRRYPSTPVLIYTVLSASTMHAVVQMARVGIEEVVLHRFDDEPDRFRTLLERAPAQALVDRLLHALAEPLAALPLSVVEAVEQMLRLPERFRTTEDLARAAAVHPRTLYRALHAAGVPSARLLVAAARLLRAYTHLREPGRSIKVVAERTGYHSPWHLTQQMRALTGLTPRWVRRRVRPEEFVALVAARLRAAPGAPPVRGEDGEDEGDAARRSVRDAR